MSPALGQFRFAAERRAIASLVALLRRAKRCRAAFDEAGVDYPEPLRRMLGEAARSPGASDAADDTTKEGA